MNKILNGILAETVRSEGQGLRRGHTTTVGLDYQWTCVLPDHFPSLRVFI